MKAYNTHQILYAKNFYAHTGNIIADMRKVCKLDNPNWNFSTPKQILKFMSKQYLIWLQNTPEVKAEDHPKVAWDDDPIAAEMWAIINKYSTYVPMTQIHGYIDGLPRYDVLNPQYNARLEDYTYPFNKHMSVDKLTAKAKEILNVSNLEFIDILANNACEKYDYEKAAQLLYEFDEIVSAQELDDELWQGYSNLVGLNLDENDNLPERYYHIFTKHFSIDIRPVYKPNETFEFEVNLIPFKFEYTSDVECTIDNILDERVKCLKEVIKQYKDCGVLWKISEVCKNTKVWDAPSHLFGNEEEILEEMADCVNLNPENWEYYGITPENEWKWFNKATDEYNPSVSCSGCFRTSMYNCNGKMKISIAFETMFECACSENKLWNPNGLFINSPLY